VAIRVNDVVGVGGFVLPGDRVDLLYTRNGTKDESPSTDILLQNVRVLAIDQEADQKKDQPQVVKVVTLEVKALDAQKIALAQMTGSLSLTLRAAGSLDRAAAQRVVEQELVSSPSIYQSAIDAEKAAQAELEARLRGLEKLAANPPKPAEPEPAAFMTATNANTTVGVTRGTKRETYEVPLERRATQ
jgi:pilus assembly protein CpaB